MVAIMNTNTNSVVRKRRGLMGIVTVVLAMLALTINSGCVAVVAASGGATAVAWVRGELRASLSANYDNTVKATNQAIQQLGFAKISEERDALKAVIVARTAGDKKIKIVVDRIGDTVTNVNIRVGIFGDERISLTLLDKIKADL